MPSLYARYLEERTNDQILEIPEGFATYRYLNDKQVYLIDLFILPEFRNKGVASLLANTICEKARVKGCTEFLGTVVPSCKNATDSIRVLIAYGMVVSSSSDNLIVFKKGI